jgi:2'-5' RNA ligase
MPPIRAFIAIESSREVLDALVRLQARLRAGPGGEAGRWVRSEGAHLTVKFLGDVPEERVAAIGQCLDAVCARYSAFALQVAGLGCFPNTRRPRVVWAGVHEETGALAALQRELESALETLGFPREQRPYAPHLTLARVREGAASVAVEALGQSVVAQQDKSSQVLAQMQVSGLTLFRSDLRPEGPLYTTLHHATLEC